MHVQNVTVFKRRFTGLNSEFSYFVSVLTKLRLVYSRWRWQAFSLTQFTYAYRHNNAKCIAGIRLDNILFWNLIQPQAIREKYDCEIFEQAQHEDNTKCLI